MTSRLRDLLFTLRAPLIISVAITVATLVPQAKSHIVLNGSYPAVVCPGALSGANESITLPSSSISTRLVAGSSTTLKSHKTTVVAGSSAPTFVSGNSGAEIALETISGTSTAETVCDVGGADEWFIGGSAGVTSQGVLQIINSGLSDSVVQLFPYSSKVALAPISLTIKANSSRNIPLASIVPGEESIALHVVTQSGRVTSFVLDHRKDGLHDLGSSFVAGVAAATTKSYIAALYGNASKSTSIMRFLVPGNVNATVHLTIFSGGGTLTPVGFDSLSIAHQRVVDVPLPKISLSTPYGIEVDSDQPIFASTITRTTSGGSDFAWGTQIPQMSNFKINLGGAATQFLFIGQSPSVKADWRDQKGRAQSQIISGDTQASWHPQGAINTVSFTVLSKKPVYGGALISNSAGALSYLPLIANQLVSRAQLPVADVRTLARR